MMSLQKLYSGVRNFFIKACGYLTGLMAVAISLATTYLYIIIFAAKALLSAPLFFNRLTVGLLRLAAFLPLPLSSVVAANLTPFVVASITIATPLFILFAYSIPVTFKLGTIPGEAIVVGGEPMISGVINGIKSGLGHVVRRLYELFVKSETTPVTSVAKGGGGASDAPEQEQPPSNPPPAAAKGILNMFDASAKTPNSERISSDVHLNLPQSFAVTLQPIEQADEVDMSSRKSNSL